MGSGAAVVVIGVVVGLVVVGISKLWSRRQLADRHVVVAPKYHALGLATSAHESPEWRALPTLRDGWYPTEGNLAWGRIGGIGVRGFDTSVERRQGNQSRAFALVGCVVDAPCDLPISLVVTPTSRREPWVSIPRAVEAEAPTEHYEVFSTRSDDGGRRGSRAEEATRIAGQVIGADLAAWLDGREADRFRLVTYVLTGSCLHAFGPREFGETWVRIEGDELIGLALAFRQRIDPAVIRAHPPDPHYSVAPVDLGPSPIT